jgi:hypothetical protein
MALDIKLLADPHDNNRIPNTLQHYKQQLLHVGFDKQTNEL